MTKDIGKVRQSRPISPHLSIYRPQISSVLSIGHRLSGIGLFLMFAAICWWFIIFTFSGFQPCYIKLFDNIFVKILLVLTSYAFFYHLCTGLRHLVWDTGRGFSICAMNFSGWFSITASIILTVIFWLMII